MGKTAARHNVAGVALGLAAGALMLPSLLLAPIILLPTLVAAVLGTWAGWPALLAATASYLAAGYAQGGALMALAVAEIALLPAWGICLILGRRPRFYEGVAQSAFLQFGALLVLVVGAWLVVRQDLIGYAMNLLRQALDSYPSGYMGAMLSYLGEAGLFGGQTGLDFSRALDAGEQAALLDGLFSLYTGQLQQTFAQMMLCSGLLSGAVGYWLCARVAARRGDDPPVSYAHPRDWRLPAHLIVGPAGCALICYVAYAAGMEGADAAYLAMAGLASMLFSIQGLGAVDRLLFKSGAGARRRGVTLALLAVIAQLALPVVGLASALLGSKGLISTWLKKRAQSNDKGGDGQ